ncbi:Intraflagellar transport protein 80 [Dinochytrium kinnereticum]|nr:Intraflagellar transport protein 80 [Dinochytrium kinnereticum]
MEWKNYEVTLLDDRKIKVHDVIHGANENLEFRDRIVKTSLGFFVVVDNFTGVQIFTYEGRTVSHPKYPGLRPESVTLQTISLSNDILAIRDRTDEKLIFAFEVATGRQIGDQPIRAPSDILEISLNQVPAPASGRQLLIIDKNRDLYITPVIKPNPKKLGTMVETMAWNDEADMFAAMVDGKFVVWYYPNVVFIDEDIEPITRFEKDGSAPFDDQMGLFNISPLPAMLQDIAKRKHWEEAIRICRYAKMRELWACLAAMAVAGQDLNTAELAYAAIDEVQKVQYICHIRDIPTAEGRSAELALLRKQPKEAEAILISAGLVYRAIRMWINLFNWDRALELAVKYKTHVDTVLYFRDKYLQGMSRKETIKQFLQYSQTVSFSWDKIKSKIAMEEESERSRPSAKPYHG